MVKVKYSRIIEGQDIVLRYFVGAFCKVDSQ